MYRGLAALGIILAAILFFAWHTKAQNEILEIKSLHNTAAQSKVLTELLDRVGPVEAQEELLRSGLPFTGETHLLVHTIGNYIYEKYGPAGLSYCRDYFLSACYHAFILNDLADHGLPGMVEVMKDCANAGPGVLPQCAHGSGHGFVAWHDYDLLKALAMCDELGGKVPNFPYFNCYDGVFMENFWGIHSGTPSPKRWVSDTDIYYPCTDPRIPTKYINACWGNQATSIYQHFKGDLKKTAEACDAVPDPEHRSYCYNNFARQIHPMTQGDASKAFSLCDLATGDARKNECIMTIVSSAWSVGDRVMPFEICNRLTGPMQNECSTRLIGLIAYYYPAQSNERKLYCAKIGKASTTQCVN